MVNGSQKKKIFVKKILSWNFNNIYPSITLVDVFLIKLKYNLFPTFKTFYFGNEYVGLLNKKGEIVFHLLCTFEVFPKFSYDSGGYHGLVTSLDYFFMKSIREHKSMVKILQEWGNDEDQSRAWRKELNILF